MNLFGKFPLVRLHQLWDNPSLLWTYAKRLVYDKYVSHRYVSRYADHTFLAPQETLSYLIDNDASLARFNDGEMGMLKGYGIYPPDSDWSQRYDAKLRARLEDVLASSEPDLLVAVPPPHVFLASRTEAKERGELYTMWTDARLLLYRFLRKDRTYGDANVFIPFHHKDFDWKRLYAYLENRDVVIVTGGTSALFDISLGRRMFFVEAGKNDAFSRYNRVRADLASLIESESLSKDRTLIMASLGTSANLLAYDLTREGWQVWDTGHFFRYADRRSFEDGSSRRVFTKQMYGRASEEVRAAFEKSKVLYDASREVDGLTIPKPLSHTVTTIEFERLDLPETFLETLTSGQGRAEDFMAIGCALGSLHKGLGPAGEPISVHGDLWTHNLAVRDGEVYMFDSEAPALASSSELHMNNSRYFDIASFVASLYLSESFKRPWRLFAVEKHAQARTFLRAYERSYGVPNDASELSAAIEQELLRWKVWQEAHGYPRAIVAAKYALARSSVRRLIKDGIM